MPTLSDLAALLESRLNSDRFDGSGITDALAEVAAQEAPRRTGALAASIRPAGGGAASGKAYRAHLTMLRYGQYVQSGHRTRTGGTVPPNAFITRAAERPEVRAAVRTAILQMLLSD